MIISEETPDDWASIDALHACALGPGRFARAAERLREANAPIAALCLAARTADGRLAASVRCWPTIVDRRWPTVLLGPLATLPSERDRGFGLGLLNEVAARARGLDIDRIVLVGDPPYYARAGYAPTAPGALTFPGPVDPGRVLGLALKPGAFEGVSGRLAPAPDWRPQRLSMRQARPSAAASAASHAQGEAAGRSESRSTS